MLPGLSGQYSYKEVTVMTARKELEKRLEKDWNRLMPSMGKANTAAGEIIRALNRILYRWYNDGDKINEGYGRETCNPAARYLMEKCPDGIGEKISRMWQEYMLDSEYEEALVDMADMLLNWIMTTDLDKVPNNEDMLDWRDPNEDRDDYDDEYDDEDDYDYDDDYEEE